MIAPWLLRQGKEKGRRSAPFDDRRLGRTQIDRRHPAALSLLELEVQLLAFVETVHAGPLDSGDVNKDVSASIRRLDKPVSLLGIEPFDRTGRHVAETPFSIQAAARRAADRTSVGSGNTVRCSWRSAGSEAEPKRVDGQLGKRKRRFTQDPYAAAADFCRAVSEKATYAQAVYVSETAAFKDRGRGRSERFSGCSRNAIRGVGPSASRPASRCARNPHRHFPAPPDRHAPAV